MKNAEQIAKALLMCEAVKVSVDPPFTWVSGIKSPVYCDNRKMIAFPEEREMIVDEFVRIIGDHNLDVDVIAGTATAAIPWAAFVAQKMKKPMVYIRPEPKDHGAKKQIEGFLRPGQKVVLLEDLISTGGSSLKAVEALKNEGQCEVPAVLAIMTWELDKARENFAGSNLPLYTLTDFTHIIGLAKAEEYLTEDQYTKVMEFKSDPATWAQRVGLE